MFSRALVGRRARTITAVLWATSGLFGLSLTAWCGLAAATPIHLYESSFGSFSNVQGVAVDESSGDVYVYDAGAGEVLKYTAAGVPAEFSATKTNAITGIGGAGAGENEIAVDNSSGPAKGDIYVAHGSSANVLIYSAAGQQIGELTEEAGKPWGEACGVAVDRSGNVYVGLYGSHVNEYTPTANPVTDLSYAGSLSELSGVCNIAANAAGDVYVDTWSSGPVTRYEATQFNSLEIPAVGQQLDAGGSTLAVDQSDGDVYVNEGSQVTAYDSSGGLLNAFAGSGAGAIGGSQGVAVSEASGKVYVSDGSGHIEIFGEVDVEPPLVTVGSPTGVTSRQATLNGTVNPQGTEAPSSTEWHFEYSLDGGSSWESTAVQDAGAGTSPVAVSAQITGLHSAEEVQDRLVATNQAGTTTSTVQTFTTAAFGPPQASTDAATQVATQEARLRARVNPEGQATTYHFEYGTTITYGADAPVPDGEINSGRVAVPASAHIASLTPGATYHYRIVATNATGTTDGEDATFTTYPARQQGGECLNEARREEQNSTYLPECRAYEMVSPLDKNGADIEARGQATVSSSDGEHVAYAALAGFAGTAGSGTLGYTQYVASREGTHWSTRGVTPTPAREAFQFTAGATTVVAFSQDLSHALVEAYDLPAVSGDIPGGINYYSEDVATGALEAITTPLSAPLGAFEATIGMWGTLATSAPDLGVVTVETEADLLPETTGGGEKLYAWENGKLTVAGVLPDGTLPPGGSASPKSQGKFQGNGGQSEGSIADQDGSRIPFVSPASGEHQLYLRRDGTSTAWVSESEASVPVAEPREVRFQAISADGRRILFTTSDSLLDGDPGGLYMYTDSPSPATESNLTFIAPTTSSGQVVSGISEDAERIYFYTFEQPGIPQTGTYLWAEGTLHFVTPYDTVDSFEQSWGRETSADGRQFAYMTREGEEGGLFVYDEQTESLRCASCLPGGGGGTGARVIPEEKSQAFNGLSTYSRPRFITADGRHVFFSTNEPLVAGDTNGLEDVYEYDVQSGAVSLLSSGTGENPAWLGAMSASGNDVFILTRQPLVRGDTDTLRDLYDVRVDGGFPEPPPQTGPCVGDECQGTPSAAPSFNTASGFNGLGNTAAKAGGESKPKTTAPAAKLTRAQRLKQALKVCTRKPKRARKRCEAQARKKYGARKARRSTSNRVGR